MELIATTVPRIPPGGFIPHVPHPGPQHLFLCLDGVVEVFYGGAAGGGKALALDTPVPGPDGWAAMGEVGVGSRVWGSRGAAVDVVGVSETEVKMALRVCFDDGTEITAAADHRWVVHRSPGEAIEVTTAELRLGDITPAVRLPAGRGVALGRHVMELVVVGGVPVRCVQLDAAAAPDGLFLVGPTMVPTHNSDALLSAALQYVDVPGYAALLLRRTWPDLSQPGALMDRAAAWLRGTAAVSGAGGRIWRFPSGARLVFGYAQHDDDVEQYASAEFQYIGIDELTRGWAKRSYEFLFSRLRKPTDAVAEASSWDGTTLAEVPLRMRSASNPGGVSHGWVREAFVDPTTRSPGVIFVPARLVDNPSLDPDEYAAMLGRMVSSPVERDRLLLGDWDVVDEGNMFHRDWFGAVDPEAVPVGCQWCRYWDLAAANPKRPGSDGDFTAGALVGLSPQGQWYIADVRRMRGTPLETERYIGATLEEDLNLAEVIPTFSSGALFNRMEQEPGAGGVITIDHYRRGVFVGADFDGNKVVKDKSERARPVSSAAQGGNVLVVRGWPTRDMFDQFDLFPWGSHDDMVDSVSGAVEVLAAASAVRRSHRTRTTAVAHRRLR